MTSPFVFDVSMLHGEQAVPEQRTQTGLSPERIGVEMIGIPEDSKVVVDATLSPLGESIYVDAEVSATVRGLCVRCLKELDYDDSFHVEQVFAHDVSDFFDNDDDVDLELDGDDAVDAGEHQVLPITDDTIDLLQPVIDVVGLALPFNPTCPNGCDSSDIPTPDGISGEDESNLPDPRWAGLERFL